MDIISRASDGTLTPYFGTIAERGRFEPMTLIAYKGGGYDGCFWEWNFSFVDIDGDYFPIIATGYMGCTTREQMEKYTPRKSTDVDTYGIEDEEDWKRFVSDFGAINVQRVGTWLNTEQSLHLTILCDKCSQEVLPEESYPSGLYGNGGIGSSFDYLYCMDCAFIEDDEDTEW